MNTEKITIKSAIKQICDEKGISYESVIETIEAALGAAFRKDFGNKKQNIKVEFDVETGQSKIFDLKTVVEDLPEEELKKLEANEYGLSDDKKTNSARQVAEPAATEPAAEAGEEKKRFNPKTDLQLADAKKVKKSAAIGDELKIALEVPGEFGRMAAQTAKQVITQKLREAERENQYKEFKSREGEIMIGTVQRREGRLVLIDLGRLTAVLPPEEQIERESYNPGEHIKVYVLSVSTTTKGPEVVVSRSHPDIVKKLFATEIPEISSGVVQIKAIAREAGARTKVAVWTGEENIDPIGSCIGQRGARVQTIISELKGEKIDIIEYDEDQARYISNALSPAKITEVRTNNEFKSAIAVVPEDNLSLAIGKSGQNVRLAARLTGWKIDIISEAEAGKVPADNAEKAQAVGEAKPEETQSKSAASDDKAKAETEPVAEVKIAPEEKKVKKSKKSSKKTAKKGKE